MKTKNNALGLRQQLRKDLRKQDLQKRFKQNRNIMKDIQIQSDQKQFNSIYPNIDDQNYIQYLDFFIKYLYNDGYNFMLVPLTGYIYEYLLENPEKSEGYIILEGLSQFQEVEVPQTEEFAQVMANYLGVQGKASMNIVANLLSYPKYASCLREYLYQSEFIEKAEKYINYLAINEEQTQKVIYIKYLFISICTSFMTIHPILPLSHLQSLTLTLTKHASSPQQNQLILQTISQISTSINPNPSISTLFLTNFKHLLLKNYFNYQYQIITFSIFCTKSKTTPFKQLLNLLMKSLTSTKLQVIEKILIFINITLQSNKQRLQEMYYQQLKDYQIIEKIILIYKHSSLFIKLQSLQIISYLIQYVIKDQDRNQQILLEDVVIVIIQALEVEHSNDLLNLALKIIYKSLYQIVNEESRQTKIVIGKILESNFFQSKIQNIRKIEGQGNYKGLDEIGKMYDLIKKEGQGLI